MCSRGHYSFLTFGGHFKQCLNLGPVQNDVRSILDCLMLVLHPPIFFGLPSVNFSASFFFCISVQISFSFFSLSNLVLLLSSCLPISFLLYYTHVRLFFPLYLCWPFDICVFLCFFPHLKLLVCFPASTSYLLLCPSHCPYIYHCHAVGINMLAYFFQPYSGPAQEDKVTAVQFQFLFI